MSENTHIIMTTFDVVKIKLIDWVENICQQALMDLANEFRVELELVPRFIKRIDSLGLYFMGHWQFAGWPDLQLQMSAGQGGPPPAASASLWYLSVAKVVTPWKLYLLQNNLRWF